MYILRKAETADLAFLTQVHHVTLKPYVEEIWGWTESRQDAFVMEDFETGQIQVIEQNKVPSWVSK